MPPIAAPPTIANPAEAQGSLQQTPTALVYPFQHEKVSFVMVPKTVLTKAPRGVANNKNPASSVYNLL